MKRLWSGGSPLMLCTLYEHQRQEIKDNLDEKFKFVKDEADPIRAQYKWLITNLHTNVVKCMSKYFHACFAKWNASNLHLLLMNILQIDIKYAYHVLKRHHGLIVFTKKTDIPKNNKYNGGVVMWYPDQLYGSWGK